MKQILRLTLLTQLTPFDKPQEVLQTSVEFESQTDAAALYRKLLIEMPNPVQLDKLKV